MFIGGLNWDTTGEGLVAYFSKFGEVLDYTIMRDNTTGRSRGFGFLTFKDPQSVDQVIKTDHVLDGKLIDPKRAIAREEQDRVGKIFVGGIDPMVNERDFNEFFSQFGSIIDAQLMIDKDTGRSRGFGFITFDSLEAVDRVTVNKYLTLKGKSMEVKRAEPRGVHQHNQMMQHHQGYQGNSSGGGYGGGPSNGYGGNNSAGGYGGGYNGGSLYYNQNSYGQNTGYQQAPQMLLAQQAYPQQQPQHQMTPEMMQEYWQRMQQWYMYQQQMAQQGVVAGMPGVGDASDQPAQPLNPQQQSEEVEDGRDNYGNNNREYPQESPDDGGASANDGTGYSNPLRDSRRMNLPKGPRRAPPSGPAAGVPYRGGRGGRRGGGPIGGSGFHPYRRGAPRGRGQM